MTDNAANLQRASLGAFAGYLASQQTVILEQWLLIVHRDTQIESADRMPHQELVDHLPRLLQELCAFLRARDADILTGDVRRDATSHGELRWQDGYRIDELLRELEALRQLIASCAFRYGERHPDFQGGPEISAQALIHQFFAEIIVVSARQFMTEQQHVFAACEAQLATAQRELGRAQARLERAHAFVEQLADYTELSGGLAQAQQQDFDPRVLFSEIVAAYRSTVETKGLRLLTECATAPASVRGDRERVRTIAAMLLEAAAQRTSSGHVAFAFVFAETPHWTLSVSDTSAGSAAAVADAGLPVQHIALENVAERVALLGGSLHTETRDGVGTRVDVTLPRDDCDNSDAK